jgi:TonB family protein
MKRTVFRCSALIAALMFTLFAHRVAAAPDGVAPYIELQRELFLAGLFLPESTTDVQLAFAQHGSRQMEIRFIADHMTAGKLSRLFLQSIAINNSVAAQRASGESLARFFNAFKGSLRAGDILAISERTDGGGVNVYLNQQRLVNITDPNFFNLLLATWIGSVPPSREFKHALLGNSAPGDIARYEALAPAPERLSLVEQWQKPAPVISNTAESGDVLPQESVTTSKRQAVSSVAGEQVKHQASVAALPAVVPVSVPAPEAPNSALATPPAATDVAAELEGEPMELAAPSPVLAVASQGGTPRQSPEPDDDLPDFSVASLELLQDYTATLVALTHAEITYPRRAMKLQQSGSVRMAVVLNASGDVLEVQPLLTSGHKQLDEAVRRAIDKAAPYPAIPPDLAAEHFEFVFPITFMLERS